MRSGPSARSNQILLAVQAALAACGVAMPALAQQPGEAGQECKPGQAGCVQEVVVTGSRLAPGGGQAGQPLSGISAEAIGETRPASGGDLPEQLTTRGQGLNTKVKSSRN